LDGKLDWKLDWKKQKIGSARGKIGLEGPKIGSATIHFFGAGHLCRFSSILPLNKNLDFFKKIGFGKNWIF